MDGLSRVIDIVGSGTKLASLLDVNPMTITQWKRRGVPAERVLDLVKASGCIVKPYEIRPDIYPDERWLPCAGEGQ